MDVGQLSPRVQYLLWHVIVLQGRGRALLERSVTLDRLIVLTDPPRHSWAYPRQHGIWP